MIVRDRASDSPTQELSSRAFPVLSGLLLLCLWAGISARAVEPSHAPTPAGKTALPPVLSIGTITIAPPAVDASKPLPTAPRRSARTQPHRAHRLRPGDLMLPTYTLDRA